MKSLLTPRKALAALVMGLGTQSFALSIGALHGAAMVGRPLAVSVPLRPDAPEADVRCVRAEVSYGDARVPPDQVALRVEARPGAGALVHLSSPRAVDEAFVTIVLRAGCEDVVTRRFVVLADPPALQDGGVAVAAARPVAITSPAKPPRKASAARAPAPVQSRLQLAPAPVPRAGVLRVSTEMHSMPAGDPRQRAAAALLWQALNAQPQDWLRTADRLRTLEGEMASLRQIAIKHRDELARLREQPAAVPFMPSLPWPWALAFAAAVGLAVAVLRRRGTPASDADAQRDGYAPPTSPQTDLDHLESQLAPSRAVRAAPVSVPLEPPAMALQPAAGVEPERELQPLEFDLAVPMLEPEPAPSAAPASSSESAHLSTLVDALQEAEFLVSIGYAGRAIEVLRAYAEDAQRPSALAVLELLQLCRETGDEAGVAATQEDFRRLFGEEPPPLAASSGLEACEPALARIMAAWPEPEVLAIIEQLLFSAPAALGGFPGLHAWRDLLWLHGLARDTLRGANAREKIAASAEGTEEMTLERLGRISVDASPRRFAVDLDLGADARRHRVLERQAMPPLAPLAALSLVPPEPDPPTMSTNDEDFFDAAVAAEGRDLYLQR